MDRYSHYIGHNLFLGTLLLVFIMAFALFVPSPVMCGDNRFQETRDKKDSVHAQPWVFGQSMDRNARLWHEGMNGDVIARKKERKKTGNSDNSVNTSENMDQVLSDARKNVRKNRLGVTFKNESSSWKVSPQQKSLRPDEDKVRDSRHVVRAYADMEAAKDFNISVGPELILKDEGHGEESAKADQPDSVLGLGMKFQYDF